MRFVRRFGAEPMLGVLMADSTRVAPQERFLFQRLPFSEDLRDYTFPSFKKVAALDNSRGMIHHRRPNYLSLFPVGDRFADVRPDRNVY